MTHGGGGSGAGGWEIWETGGDWAVCLPSCHRRASRPNTTADNPRTLNWCVFALVDVRCDRCLLQKQNITWVQRTFDHID